MNSKRGIDFIFLSLLLLVLEFFVFPTVPMGSYVVAIFMNSLCLAASIVFAVLGLIALTRNEHENNRLEG